MLKRLSVDFQIVRGGALGRVADQKIAKKGAYSYTQGTNRVIAIAEKEVSALGHFYLGTEHLLLGLLIEGESIAARVLQSLGVGVERGRNEILDELDSNLTPLVDEE